MLSLFQRKRVPPATSAPTPKPSAEPGKGLMRPEPAASLLATPRRQKLLEHIWQRTRCRAGSSPRCTSPRWNATPSWSSNSRVGGPSPRLSGRHAGPRPGDRRLRAQAAAVASAARRRHAGGASRQAEAWTAGTAYAALLHDIGKIAVDLHVEYADGTVWHPGTARCGGRTASATAGREYRLHSAATGLLYARLLDPGIFDWLAGYPDLWAALLYVLAGQYEHAGMLGELVVQADQASVAQELGGDPSKALAAPGTHCSASCSMACATS